jgi:ribosomal-protein-alanine N-acetyltransferase
MKRTQKLTRKTHRTRRLVLRPYRPADYQTWYDAYVNRLPRQNKYDREPSKPEKCSKREFLNVINRHEKLAANDKVYIYPVFDRKSGVLVGAIDIAILIRENYQLANLGYQIHNRHWQKGFGSEATRAGIFIAFDDLKIHRLEAAINTDNVASIALAQSIGMHCDGVRKHYLFEDNCWVDHVIFSAIPEDFGRPARKPWPLVEARKNRKKGQKIKR